MHSTDMTREEKLRFYATAPRAGAKKIHQVQNGDFAPRWIACLRGRGVTLNRGENTHPTRNEAVEHAREFRAACRRDLEEMEGAP